MTRAEIRARALAHCLTLHPDLPCTEPCDDCWAIGREQTAAMEAWRHGDQTGDGPRPFPPLKDLVAKPQGE